MSETTDTIGAYAAAFERFETSLNGGADTALHGKRREAISRLVQDGLPTARFEAWRHTNPASMTRACFVPVAEPGHLTASSIEAFLIAGTSAVLVFADGRFVPELSRRETLPEGLRVSNLATVTDVEEPALMAALGAHTLGENSGFSALNTAFIHDAAVIAIDSGCTVDEPVQILHVRTSQPGLTAPRTLVVAESDSRVSIVETFVGMASGAGSLTASVAEIVVGRASVVEHTRIHLHGAEGHHAGTVHVAE